MLHGGAGAALSKESNEGLLNEGPFFGKSNYEILSRQGICGYSCAKSLFVHLATIVGAGGRIHQIDSGGL